MQRFTPTDAQKLMEILKARRDVRGNHFTDEPVSDEEIDTILEAGLYAPSVGYSQPWKFVVIRDPAIQEQVYDEFARTHKKSKKKFKHRPLYAGLKLEALRETSVHIAVFYHHQGGAILGQTSQEDAGRYSVAAAIENMWLMARAMNIGIGWVSIVRPGKIRKIIGLGKAYQLVGYLCVGKVDRFLESPELESVGWQARKSTAETVLRLEPGAMRGGVERVGIIRGSHAFLAPLTGKRATFMLALANTATAQIEGITQAGLPGLMHLTPTLDAEFLSRGKLKSLKKLPRTHSGIPTPALITRSIEMLHPFGRIEALDLGLEVPPQFKGRMHAFGIPPSGSIATGAGIDARAVFETGVAFGRNYTPRDPYVILGESVPSGTTTATATALALGYPARDLFSSSFRHVPDSIRGRTIDAALARVKGLSDPFEILSEVSDNMLIFNAGLILGVGGRFPILLAGGTQMAAVLLVANTLNSQLSTLNSQFTNHYSSFLTPHSSLNNVALATTKWVAHDPHSDITALLGMLDFPIDAYYADFDFSLADQPALKRYDEGEAKEGVGAGGALVYGLLNGLTQAEITRQVEGYVG